MTRPGTVGALVLPIGHGPRLLEETEAVEQHINALGCVPRRLEPGSTMALVRWLITPGHSWLIVVVVAAGDQPGALMNRALRASRLPVGVVVVDEAADGAPSSATLLGATTRVLVAAGGGADQAVPRHASLATWRAALEAMGVPNLAAPHDGIAPLSLADLDDIVAVHMEAFPASVMSLLGSRVAERYYRWQFIGPHPAPFAHGAWHDGRLVGLLFGGVRRDAVSGFARRFLPSVLFGAATHPFGTARLAGPKLFGVLRLMARRGVGGSLRTATTVAPGGSSPPRAGADSFGVLAIAVTADARGTGAAAALLAAAESAAKNLGLSGMHLSVDVENGRAIRFYEKHGWTKDASNSEWRGRMTKNPLL